jgi:hypothetical protein
MTVIPDELLNQLATEEVNALLEGLRDEEQRRNPAFLGAVRKFLQQNKLMTTPETEGIPKLKTAVEEIPTFDFDNNIVM